MNGINVAASENEGVSEHVELHVDRDGLTGKLQIGISRVDGKGSGSGYRLAGPKYSGTGSNLLTHRIDERDARMLLHYITPLIGVDEGGKPAPRWDGPGLSIRLEYRLRWGGGRGVFAAVIEEPRKTASGRAGKPNHIITLVNDDSPHALLREVADLLDPDGPEIERPDPGEVER